MKICSNLAVSLGLILFVFLMPGSIGSAPIKITNTPGWLDTSPRMAVDSLGNVHLAWAQYYGGTSATTGDAMYMKYDVLTKQWTLPLNLSNNSQVHSTEFRPVGIDVDASNNVYVVYSEKLNKRIILRVNSGGNWSAAIVVASLIGLGDSVRVALDPKGNIFTSWWDIGTYTCYSRARIDGNWENVIPLSTNSGGSKFPDIAVGKNAAYACWTGRGTGIYQIYWTKRSTALNASWSVPQIIKVTTIKQQTPTVAVDSHDVAHIVYAQVITDAGIRAMDYSYSTANGFSPPQSVSGETLQHYPSMCEQANNIYATWQVGGWMNGTSVNFNNQIIKRWTGENAIPGSQGCTYPDVAVSPYQDKVYHVWDANSELWFNTQIQYNFGQLPVYDGHDYDGDGASEVSIFRPHKAFWCIKDMTAVYFGVPGDIPVPGDYDGNGTTDIAIFRPAKGLWAVKDQLNQFFGQPGDIPVPGDYDGDGKTDFAVYRPSTGEWFIKGQLPVLFGGGGNIVVPGDYDGDGKTDLALFNPTSGVWHVKNQFHVVFGKTGDIPVPADYNGDKKTDLAIFRPSTGLWAVKDLLNVIFGRGGDIPTPGDYDGDGSADIAIFRPSTGLWAIKDQFYTIYGLAGDIPLVR